VRVTFQVVRARQERAGYCPVCGKLAKRSRTFEQTVNPWNRNEDGSEKTPQEVALAVRAEANAWHPTADDLTHAKCREGGSDD